ncbi:hypothetical protein PMAYCL1PPCAC_22974, partial [Pristionchus mayeri]
TNEAVEVPFPKVDQILRHGVHQWKVEKCIYSGPFSDVFVIAECASPSKKYAMKVERVVGVQRPVLKLDAHVLPQLKGQKGFPELVVSGRTAAFKYCVMQLVGPDLSKLRKVMPGGKFSLATALNIGYQTLHSLEHLHTSGWLCRDVKAPNLAVGRGADASTVYMLDFGFARRFLNKDNKYRAQRPTAPLLGTMPYASLAAHCRKEQSPRDDVESWFYMIVEFVIGALPWSYMPKDTILEYKQHIRMAGHREFFARLPPAFAAMLAAIDRTGFYDRPDYNYLRFLLESAAGTEKVDLRSPLDWVANPMLYSKAEKLGEDVTEVPCAAEQSAHDGSVRDLAPLPPA